MTCCWSASVHTPCLVSSAPPKIPCVGFSLDTASSDHSARCLPVRVPLPVTAEPPFCAGLRVRRLRSRTAGQMRPHIPRRRHGLHRPTGAASSYSVSGVLCPRRCPLLHQGSPTGPSLPLRLCCPQRHRYYGPIRQTRAREPFSLLAYTVRPAVHGRSRRGASPSQLCVVCLPLVPLPIRRRDSPTSLARLSVGGNSLRPRGPGSAPSCSPALTSARGTHYVAAAFA